MVSAARVAFFDVDETLITLKSLPSFLHFHWARAGHRPERAADACRELTAQAARGVPRENLNRAFFRLLTGSAMSTLRRDAERWAAIALDDGLLHQPVVAKLRRHLTLGHTVVLVSGSFEPCLRPIADHLGVEPVLCTEPVVAGDGTLTGETGTPMIGEAKAEAARRMLAALGSAAADATAYADDPSDLPLLRAVGNPVVVGDDPLLREQASRHSWALLPAARTSAVPSGRGALSGALR